MSEGRSRALAGLLVIALVTGSCTRGSGGPGAEGDPGIPGITIGPDGIARLVDDPSGPYVITAIDYHFHDAHPTIPLAPERTLIVHNVGRNVHNVTILGTPYARDVNPGERLVIPHIGELLGEPGEHRFVCRYHADRDMTGTIVVAG